MWRGQGFEICFRMRSVFNVEVKCRVSFRDKRYATSPIPRQSVCQTGVIRHEVRLHGTSLGGRPPRCNYILTRESFQASEESAPASSSGVVDLAVLVVGLSRLFNSGVHCLNVTSILGLGCQHEGLCGWSEDIRNRKQCQHSPYLTFHVWSSVSVFLPHCSLRSMRIRV